MAEINRQNGEKDVDVPESDGSLRIAQIMSGSSTAFIGMLLVYVLLTMPHLIWYVDDKVSRSSYIGMACLVGSFLFPKWVATFYLQNVLSPRNIVHSTSETSKQIADVFRLKNKVAHAFLDATAIFSMFLASGKGSGIQIAFIVVSLGLSIWIFPTCPSQENWVRRQLAKAGIE